MYFFEFGIWKCWTLSSINWLYLIVHTFFYEMYQTWVFVKYEIIMTLDLVQRNKTKKVLIWMNMWPGTFCFLPDQGAIFLVNKLLTQERFDSIDTFHGAYDTKGIFPNKLNNIFIWLFSTWWLYKVGSQLHFWGVFI